MVCFCRSNVSVNHLTIFALTRYSPHCCCRYGIKLNSRDVLKRIGVSYYFSRQRRPKNAFKNVSINNQSNLQWNDGYQSKIILISFLCIPFTQFTYMNETCTIIINFICPSQYIATID